MRNRFKKTSLALAIGLVLVLVVPVAADLVICLDERPDRDCCDESPAPDTQTEAAACLLEGANCNCCIRVHVANAADATVQKTDVVCAVESGNGPVNVAPNTRRIASAGRDAPDIARLPSLGTVVLLI